MIKSFLMPHSVFFSPFMQAIASGSGSGSSPLTDCNFHSIASTCYSFNHRRLVFEDRFEVGCAAQQRVPIAAQQWINKNEVPQAVADYISNIM